MCLNTRTSTYASSQHDVRHVLIAHLVFWKKTDTFEFQNHLVAPVFQSESVFGMNWLCWKLYKSQRVELIVGSDLNHLKRMWFLKVAIEKSAQSWIIAPPCD